jgi:hypothetical protein
MRRANDIKVLTEGTEFIGIGLGADFCAEHEWGIKELISAFDIRDSDIATYGVEKRRINKVPENLKFAIEKDKAALVFRKFWFRCPTNPTVKDLENGELQMHGDINTAWSDGEFGILVKGEENLKWLKELHEAFQRKDVAFWIGGSGPFRNGGLTFGIISKLPEEAKLAIYTADFGFHKLDEADKATGIREKLIAANKKELENKTASTPWDCTCGFTGLRAAWTSSMLHSLGERKTTHEVIYWVNPHDNRKNNYGWFTVEELEQWTEGKGPIPKTAKKQKA